MNTFFAVVSAKGHLINKKIVSLSALVADWEKSGSGGASLTVLRLAAANPKTFLSRWLVISAAFSYPYMFIKYFNKIPFR